MSASPVARIEQLEEIEKDVISILQTAGATLLEVAKDRPAQKTVDTHTQNVMADIKRVEQNLSEQIKYLTQVSTGKWKSNYVWKLQAKNIFSRHISSYLNSIILQVILTKEVLIQVKKSCKLRGID